MNASGRYKSVIPMDFTTPYKSESDERVTFKEMLNKHMFPSGNLVTWKEQADARRG